MNRATLYNFVTENINTKVDTDTIKQRLEKHLAYTPVKELLELKHSGELDNRADAIIRLVAGKLYSDKA